MQRTLLIFISVLLIAPMAAQAGKRHRNNNRCGLAVLVQELPVQSLDQEETKNLLYMREEEKLARDVYLSLYEQWKMRVFRQIAQAESKHMAAVGMLITKYELVDPVGDNPLGVFTDSQLQALYEDLSAAGSASPIAALQVGAAIEDRDIYDLQNSLASTDNEDLRTVYQNLMKGSRNHLRSFAGHLERLGEDYEPVYLSPDEYQAILDTPREKGVVDADGVLVCGGGGGGGRG